MHILYVLAALIQRPEYVQQAVSTNGKLYYFGYGSNMLKSKLENRGGNNSRIDILSMKPALVYDHRLAFNLR